MYYTVAHLDDVQGDISIHFDKVGNQFMVGIYNNDNKEHTCNKFSDMESALAVFQRLTEAIITGCHSYESRKSILLGASS
ncbi:MAG: hypothetical protein ACOYJ1_05500 [Peptococcales bacterium]|jgi:hypothetical protein